MSKILSKLKHYLKIGIVAAVGIAALSWTIIYLGPGDWISEELHAFAVNLRTWGMIAAGLGGGVFRMIGQHEQERHTTPRSRQLEGWE